MRIRHVEIRGYRGLTDVHFPVGEGATLVGKNNAGKSSILEAIGWFFHRGEIGPTREDVYTWRDEDVDTLLADSERYSDPDLAHALQALANVVDTNPPNLHLLLRLWTGLIGSQSETVFRCFALLSMFLALCGIYVVLRDVFAPLPALAGVLAVWCHPLILPVTTALLSKQQVSVTAPLGTPL